MARWVTPATAWSRQFTENPAQCSLMDHSGLQVAQREKGTSKMTWQVGQVSFQELVFFPCLMPPPQPAALCRGADISN